MAASSEVMWPREQSRMREDLVNDLLKWCVSLGASDITFRTDRQVRVEIHGKLYSVTKKKFDGADMEVVIVGLYGNTAAMSVLAGGRPLNFSHEIEGAKGAQRQRFRVNVVSVLSRGRRGQEVTLRILPVENPEVENQNIDPELLALLEPRDGIVWITGPTGSGKTTLRTAILRWRMRRGVGKIGTLEAPIEFVFDDLDPEGSLISQQEVGVDIESFPAGIRELLRRAPEIIDIGEARDRETVGTAIQASLTGHSCMATAHTIGVVETVKRLVVEFPPDEQATRGYDIISSARAIVTQILVERVGGGRVALREYLGFDRDIRRHLLSLPMTAWPAELEKFVESHGQPMRVAAERALRDGLISEETYAWVVGRPSIGRAA